jgi:hypothetical protein
MKKTIQYTNDLLNFDMNKIPLEQQICLLKASDTVKEKAMIKLKEIKSKSEDSGSKARQYLDGLLKVPFNVYKKEPIMYLMDEIKQNFLMVVNNIPVSVPIKEKYTSIEIKKYIVSIKQKITEELKENTCQNIKNDLTNCDKNELVNNIVKINAYIDANKLEISKIKYTSNKSKEILKSNICNFVDSCLSSGAINDKFYVELLNSNTQTTLKKIIHIEELFKKINGYISNVKHTLNSSVHGHEKAKNFGLFYKFIAVSIIFTNSFGSSDAPPTRRPS